MEFSSIIAGHFLLEEFRLFCIGFTNAVASRSEAHPARADWSPGICAGEVKFVRALPLRAFGTVAALRNDTIVE